MVQLIPYAEWGVLVGIKEFLSNPKLDTSYAVLDKPS